jgi:hypothetical protein
MSAFSDFLVKTILPTIEKVGEGKLVDLLQKLHDADEEKYKAAVIAGHAFIKPLADYVGKTETDIDDGFVAAINDAITVSAANNAVVFA